MTDMTAREAVLKAAEIARQTARCPRNAVGVARDETSGWFSADQYREEGADAVADALSAFADTLIECSDEDAEKLKSIP